MNFIKYMILRLFALFVQIIGAIAVIFVATDIINLDPTVLFIAGGSDSELGTGGRSEEEIAQFKKELGLDKTLLERFVDYVVNLVTRGDLGKSWLGDREPVTKLYLDALITTIRVFGIGILLFTILAIILGILAARKMDGRLDKNIRLFTSIFYSAPPYVLGVLILYLARYFYILQVLDTIKYRLEQYFAVELTANKLIILYNQFYNSFLQTFIEVYLPPFVVILIYTGFQFRLVRIYMAEVLNKNFIRTAHAKGLDERTIIVKHALRNALPELITSIAITFPVTISGVVVLEKVFNINGSGLLLINSGLTFDWPVLIGGAVIFISLTGLILAITDILIHYINPQLRLSNK